MDFDRTLFDTDRFSDAWWTWLAETYRLDHEKEVARAGDFVRLVGVWRDYDFLAHLASLGLKDDVSTVLERGRAALLKTDFLFSDWMAVDRLRRDRPVDIVTFGNQPYQRFKLSLCPGLADWPTHIISEEKGDFIARIYDQQDVVLVDDKLVYDSLPVTAAFIHLDRHQAEPYVQRIGYRSVNSLNELEHIIDK